ncbi:MAG TPA: hypothetical protein VLE53_00025 [Gemmatimonadaceae bacterium]|nr:hypothetical protein [Gemmatimonadaceae bacterium]
MSGRTRLGRGLRGTAGLVLLAGFAAPAPGPHAAAHARPPAGNLPLPAGARTALRRQAAIPAVTLLYQNFPNPFPTTTAAETCLSFDLHRPSRVSLTIHDIRGNLVRSIVPSPQVAADLAAGRYGRSVPGDAAPCDPRFLWDGRADDGRVVAPGAYLVRLRTESHESFRRMLFRGQ